ncbi:MAG TPA: hypothetical protein VK698_24980 [Kofleriaceae bacterium]|nr:hypothetical protein [Kofleriaceae bacterium]
MTVPGGPSSGRSRWTALTRVELATASAVLARLEGLAGRQRMAVARLATPELIELGREQTELETELREVFTPGEPSGDRQAPPATAAERTSVVEQSARVRRVFQHNLFLMTQARRSVSLLLGIDEDRAAYDRRARRPASSSSARRARAF